MAKESNSTSSKKRKNNADMDSNDIYKKAIELEEKEASLRTPEEDSSMYFETCDNIRGLLADIYKLKIENKKENKPSILQKRNEACIQTTILKKLNRLDKVRMLKARETLNQEKLKVDSINLQLQNLLYELAHLKSEFDKCTQYKSKAEGIELISIDEFLEQASDDIISKFKDKQHTLENFDHELHLAMLDHELNQRIKLSKLCDILQNEKKYLSKDILMRKEKLEGLGPRLAAVIEATKPVQEHLGLPIDKIREEHKLASLLPDVLYLLYCNGDAYKQVADIGLSVNIIGDQEETIQYNETEKLANDLDSDNENDALDAEVSESKKRRHRKSIMVDKQEEKRKKLLEAHPLSVEMSLAIANGPVLKIKFSYRTQLKIITALPSIEIPSSITGNSAREVLSGECVLNELFEKDFGIESPNSSNFFQLKKLGLGSYESLVSKIGYAYHWAQRICGLDFLDPQNVKEKGNKLSRINVETVLTAMQKRLQFRYALAEQLHQIEQNCFLNIPDGIEYPKSSTSTLSKWSSINYQKFCQDIPNALQLIDSGIAGSNDLFYMVTISRPKAFLNACVIIKNDYPQQAPIFIITIKANGELNAENSDEIRDMERAVNIGWKDTANSANWLLSMQLRYLCSFFDIFLETNENSGYTQSTVFFKNVSTRNRRRPYKFRKIGNGIFTQH